MRIRARHVERKLKHVIAWLKVKGGHIEKTFAERVEIGKINGFNHLTGNVVQFERRPASGNGRRGIAVNQSL